MNYIILNGEKSTSIRGLLIQSLPHISKPLIRTEVEEIDGRDGDIVTPLGYSAYDKEITIGLYGDYDINKVISYFDSQGTVTFSNEPDKFYYYQIIEQIDFERLIRFKTATVIFHVQPFKFSAVEGEYIFRNQLFSAPDYTATKNGITLTAQDGIISVQGTGTSATEFYVPVDALKLDAGNYTMLATTDGSGANVCSVRLIKSVPSNTDSLGGTYLALRNNTTATLNAELTESGTFNYLWFYITSGTAMDFTLDMALMVDRMSIYNSGNTRSKPTMTIYGDGTVNLSLNGNQIFVIEMVNDYITIDVSEMQAYMGDLFMNRYVTGDYDALMLNMGKNTLTWTGTVSQIMMENYSRWI